MIATQTTTGWKHLKLADVISKIQGGGTPSKKEPTYWNGEIPWASVKDIVTHNPNNTLDHITELGLENSSSRLVPNGTLIVPTRMALGHAVFFSVDVSINQDLKAIYPGKELGKQYLFYWFQSKKKYIARLGSGSTVDGISQEELKNIEFLLPTLPEQEEIVEVLEAWDSYLAKLTNVIKLKKKVKKGLMQRLLTGKVRLKGFSAEWRKVRLRDACDVKGEYGINAAAVEYADNLPAYLRITDIDESGRFIYAKRKSVNNENYGKFILTEGDIVFARTGATVGKTYLYDPNDGELVFAGFLIKFHPKHNVLLPYFLKSYTNTKPYWNWVKINSSRSGQPGINGVEYGQLILNIPSIEEQTAIAQVITAADQEIEALEKKKAIIEQQKKFLLNNMITGKLRLPEFTKVSN